MIQERTADNIYYKYDQHLKYSGYSDEFNSHVRDFFSQNSIDAISTRVTSLLKNVDNRGREIVVPDKRIFEVMNSVYSSYSPPTGFDQFMTKDDYVLNMIGQAVARIVYDVKNTVEYEQCMEKKSIWTTVLGDFNSDNLRGHAPIKLRNKRPNSFEFNMKY